MTTMDSNTSLRNMVAFWIANHLRAKTMAEKEAKKASRALSPMLAFIRLMLHLSGFGLLTYAGFEWSTIAGLVIAGMSCFLISWLVTSPSQRPNQTDTRMR